MNKNLLLGMCALLLMPENSMASVKSMPTKTKVIHLMDDSRQVVFRQTQKLRSRDGREIYLYTDRTCKMWEGDRNVATCNYRIVQNEIFIYGDGVEYKGKFTLSSDRLSISSLTLGGTTYYKK